MTLQYFDFPRCREAFARGQPDATPWIVNGCYYRHRGRTKHHYTLLSFEDPHEAWKQLADFARQGARVQAMNFTSERPLDLPTKSLPVEWIAEEGYDGLAARSGGSANNLRRAAKKGKAVAPPSLNESLKIFEAWVEFAGTRHFMVFKGHYLAWLKMFYVNPGPARLVGIEYNGVVEGIFGWETLNGVHQVTLAKHTSCLAGKIMWAVGLQAIGPGRVLCGSTADKLKEQLGMTKLPSWTFDLSSLKEIKSDGPRSLATRRTGV